MNNAMNTQTLNTDRLVLNRFTVDDAAAMFHGWANSETVTRWMFLMPGKTMEEYQEYLQSVTKRYMLVDSYHHWAIRCHDKCIGTIALMVDTQHNSAQLAYALTEEYWGNGYMTEALKAVLEFGFNVLKLHRIGADHFAENPGSGKVMQNAGLKKEGITRDKYYKFGTYHDAICYGILENEWNDNP